MLALYFLHYNFCRIHKTLRVTPAMAVGISDTVRDMDWLVGMMDAVAAKPNRPARYKQAKGTPAKHWCNGRNGRCSQATRVGNDIRYVALNTRRTVPTFRYRTGTELLT